MTTKTKLNVAEVTRVADAIEASYKFHKALGLVVDNKPIRLGFNMETFGHKGKHDVTGEVRCDTVGCIAGWTLLLNGINASDSGDARKASELLGIDGGEVYGVWKSDVYPDSPAFGLFYQGHKFHGGAEDVSLETTHPMHAVEVLRHLAKTGNVDWRIGAGWSIPLVEKARGLGRDNDF